MSHAEADSSPIQHKAELVEYLKHLIAKGHSFLIERDIDPGAIEAAGWL
ncbi:MAG: hypothetical protein U5K33_07725 [Halofilum sp. (in: g-proteobacteria)]|nr:hypothetical protein [Halofilum sp. (in: g-proteobacteria)]